MLVRSKIAAAGFGVAVVATLGAHVAGAKVGDPVAALAGRWAGAGTVQASAGAIENFKCVVTYIPGETASRLRQNLRCQSPNYRLDAATLLQFDGTRVTGRWQDNIYSLAGNVNGTVTDRGFDVVLSGQFFVAKMSVVSSQCEQSVTVTPEKTTYIRQVSAALKKC
jgi:hypothetical protein